MNFFKADNPLNEELINAVENGEATGVTKCLKKGADVNFQYKSMFYFPPTLIDIESRNERRTALVIAARDGRKDIVSKLLNKGSNPNLADNTGQTALHYAIRYGRKKIVTFLLIRGSNPTLSDKKGQTPLHYAARYGQKEMIFELINKGSDPTTIDEYGQTALRYAARNGKTNTVSELIKNGSDPSSADKNGKTALHFAANNGCIYTVSELLNRGASLILADAYGRTPLHYAAMKGYLEIVIELLNRGSNPTSTDKNGETALHLAAKQKNIEVVSELLNRRSDLDIENEFGKKAFCLAAKNGDIKMVRVFQKKSRNLHLSKIELDVLPPDTKKVLQETQEKLGLLEDLRGLGLENVASVQELLLESSYKSFGNRVYLVGPVFVGKSCLAKILVGEILDGTRQSTEGIGIYMGRAGMDIDKMEWIPLATGDTISEILTSLLMSRSRLDLNSLDIREDVSGITEEMDILDTQQEDNPIQDNQDIILYQRKNDKGKQTQILTNYKQKESQRTSVMSHDKLHQLIINAVKEKKYKENIVPIDIWDFGGQKDYSMTHQLFITSRGIYVLMFNGCIDLHRLMPTNNVLPGHLGKTTVSGYLRHWVNSILTYCRRTKDGFPRIIFVASHKDEKWFNWTKEARRKKLEKELQNMFESHSGLGHLEFKPLLFVNATNPDDPEIHELKERLMKRAREHPRWGEAMPTIWVPLELQLVRKSAKGINILSRDELMELNSKNDESMKLSERQMETFLKVQHSLGKLLYFDVENLRDFIIISPSFLVEVLKSIVTEKQFWPKEDGFLSILKNLQQNGIINRDEIYYLWGQEHCKHILQYKKYMLDILVHLDVVVAPRTRIEDVSSPVHDISRFMVPCMITKENDTDFLKKFWKTKNSIILAYTFIEEVIPPALSYRFLCSLITTWDIKKIKENNKEKIMLFSDLAVVNIDNFHDIAVQVETKRVIVSLIHANTKDDIIPTIASSLQECMTAAIDRISEFYSTLSEDVKLTNCNSTMPFNIEFGVFCNSGICFFAHNEIPLSNDEPMWICQKHKQQHQTKTCTAWFSEKETRVFCTRSCSGIGRLERQQCPLPHHVRRLAAQLSLSECHEVTVRLGSKEWNALEYQFQHQPPNDLKFTALWDCTINNSKFSFDSLHIVLENTGLSEHELCQVFRDVTIDVADMPEYTLDKVPSIKALQALSNHIGNSTMQLAIELEIDVSYIQRIQHDHKNKLLEQTRKILMKWRQNQFPKPTVLRLLKALYRVGKFGPTYQIIKNHL